MTEEQKLGFDEVVDTLADIIETADSVFVVFKDGFQPLQDLIALTPIFPRIQEIVTDAPLAWQQFKDLDVEEAQTVRDRLVERLDLSNDNVDSKIKGSVKILSNVYSLLSYNIAQFNAIKADIEDLF